MKRTVAAALLLAGAVPCILATSGCKKQAPVTNPDVAFGAYDTEPDWNDATKQVKLGYRESQGRRVFYV